MHTQTHNKNNASNIRIWKLSVPWCCPTVHGQQAAISLYHSGWHSSTLVRSYVFSFIECVTMWLETKKKQSYRKNLWNVHRNGIFFCWCWSNGWYRQMAHELRIKLRLTSFIHLFYYPSRVWVRASWADVRELLMIWLLCITLQCERDFNGISFHTFENDIVWMLRQVSFVSPFYWLVLLLLSLLLLLHDLPKVYH